MIRTSFTVGVSVLPNVIGHTLWKQSSVFVGLFNSESTYAAARWGSGTWVLSGFSGFLPPPKGPHR